MRRKKPRLQLALRHLPFSTRIGRRVEAKAVRFLRRRGLTIIARNFARPFGEIDVIARDGTELVFVEVRFRHDRAWQSGLQSVDTAKQRRIIKTARSFLQAHPVYDIGVRRFDVVSVTKRNYRYHIQWTANAFCEVNS